MEDRNYRKDKRINDDHGNVRHRSGRPGNTRPENLRQEVNTSRGKNDRRRLSREERLRRRRRYRFISWSLTVVFVVVFYALICLCIGSRAMFANTEINGVDVGGMKTAEAAAAVGRELDSTYGNAVIQVKLEDRTYDIQVSSALDMDAEKYVNEIKDKSHSFWRRGYSFLESRIGGSSYEVYPKVKTSKVIKDVVDSSGMLQVSLCREDGYTIDGQELIVTKGQGSYKIDTDKLVRKIVKQVEAGDYDKVIECPVVPTDVDMDAVYEKVHTQPQNPTLDPDMNYEIVEARDGVDFDVAAAKSSLQKAKAGDQVRIPLTYTKAEMTTDEYRSLLFRDQISSYSTEVEGSDARKTNVKLAAQYCDGTILMPGESFSYNLGVGELTEERGFLPGPSYADGKSVMDMGGGICQVSSTMYMACLYANLEIDERHCHPYPSSYVPAGLDATVAWGGCDFVFTNDTDYPIKINTTYDGYSTSCTIWGTVTEAFSVELYTETLETEPYETKYELDKSLGKDDRVLDTVGIDGLTIQSYRRVYDGDGNVISDNPEAISEYSVRDEVYKVGKLPKDKKDDKKSSDSKSSSEDDSTSDSGETDSDDADGSGVNDGGSDGSESDGDDADSSE